MLAVFPASMVSWDKTITASASLHRSHNVMRYLPELSVDEKRQSSMKIET
jgi:hypothetical protein